MKISKVIKSAGSILLGATMIGATIASASAISLNDYPQPFIKDGVFNGNIVVGSNAAIEDVVSAIDLAASLQSNLVSTEVVEIPREENTVILEGDSSEFKSGSDVLSFGEYLSEVKETFTEDDMDMLETTSFSNSKGNTEVKHYLKFSDSTGKVVYEENDNDKVADYLLFESGKSVFQYDVEFTEGAESDIKDDVLEDFLSEQVDIFGGTYTIVDAKVDDNKVYMTLMGGQTSDVLKDQETKVYTIDGKDFEITAVFISENDGGQAKLNVNGKTTKALREGDSEEILDGVTVGIKEVLTNGREGLVEFYLGANKLELSDPDYTNSEFDGKVEVNDENIDSGEFMIRGSTTSGKFTLNYMKYNFESPEDYYVPSGEGLREQMDSDDMEGLFSQNWDIEYVGFTNVTSNPIEIKSSSDKSYTLKFVNLYGDSYNVPFITNEDNVFKYGDDNDDLIFEENQTVNDEDYIVITDKTSSTDDKAVTKVMQYKKFNAAEKTVEFNDLNGGTITAPFLGTPGEGATGTLVVSGKNHKFEVKATNGDLKIDLNGDGDYEDTVSLVAKGGEIINMSPVVDNGTSDTADITFTTLKGSLDEGSEDEVISVKVMQKTSEEIDLDVVSPDLVESEDDDVMITYTTYGAYVELDSNNDASEFKIEMPTKQRYAQVFVTSGSVEAKSSTGTQITTEKINPIEVGLAILDTEATLGDKPLLVVGGPCVNTIAKELLETTDNCAIGFEPGKAKIRLFKDKNALLVAGYSAQDTKGAVYVLSEYDKYDLDGDEVSVITADLNSLVVEPII